MPEFVTRRPLPIRFIVMDPRVTELHCIMPIENVPSVLANGILSYELAAKRAHRSVAMQPVQDRRDKKQVPGGLHLHQYANLYFHARNPMLYKRLNECDDLCVLRVSTEVLRIEGTVICDQNAASNYVRFLDPSQWELMPFDDIYALDWTHPDDTVAYWRHKARKCAEALIPGAVEPRFLIGAYVVGQPVALKLGAVDFPLPVTIDPVLYFR